MYEWGRKQGGRGAIYYNITIVCTCTVVYTSNTCMNRGENREAEGLYIITLPSCVHVL